ncbi:metal-dependent hydrolase [Zhongshania arctica]|uniref:Metal-dependent hydrolase n=1 Tax=Zhongshania arctica TaxID=3238302 RepID=A0ABV3TRL5_9GAMM
MTSARQKIDYNDVVQHRNVAFNLDEAKIPRYWLDKDPWLTHYMNAIFCNVPRGERFVMKATTKQLDKISDPSIRKAAIAFIRQEGSHAKAHDGLNKVLASQGLPIKNAGMMVDAIFSAYDRYLPDVMKFAFAATGEHFTATLSAAMLENPELWDDTPEDVAALAFWHFVEEVEHKSVSFDVYKDTCGEGAYSYAVLMATLGLGVSTLFTAAHLSWIYLLVKDKQITNVRSAAKTAKKLLFSPGIFTKTFVSEVVPFLSPKFHPWDNDNRFMINVWKEKYDETGDPVQAYHAFRQWHAAQNGSTYSPNRGSEKVAAKTNVQAIA